ncbi:MFS transporter [Schaalia sp. ZJ405]|uniref:MFS transporter n=1 Tax=Schaalia sp. ZJ405 TaxID=2709403 RepID=UPI0013E9B57C|nr:MFS transporter [Schaalia sp. ZJ405]QPK81301.1 MFS transporter [Schaalia sp. ZJ405]
MSSNRGIGVYRTLLTTPHVLRFLLGGVIIQFPFGMIGMALLIGVRDGYHSYTAAGIASAVMSIAGAFVGPHVGRLIDRWGQQRVSLIVGAFWVLSMCALAVVLWVQPPYWVLMVVVIMLGVTVPGGSIIRSRWRLVLREQPSRMSSALSLTSVLEECMWVLSTPIATVLATVVSPIAALVFAVATVFLGLYLLFSVRVYEPAPLMSRHVSGNEDEPAQQPGMEAVEQSQDAIADERTNDVSEQSEFGVGESSHVAPSAPTERPVVAADLTENTATAAHNSPSGPRESQRLWTVTFVTLLLILVFYGAFQTTTGVAIVAFSKERNVQAWAGAVTACFSGGSMIGAMLYGMRDWKSPLWIRFYSGLGVLALSCSALIFVDSMLTAGIIMLIAGLFQAPTVVNINQILLRIVPSSRFTEGMSFLGSMWVVGISLSNFVAGQAIDRLGSAGGFATIIGFALAALVLAVVSMPSVRRSLGSEAQPTTPDS